MFQYPELFYNNKMKYQNKNTTLSKQFKSSIVEAELKLIPIAHDRSLSELGRGT